MRYKWFILALIALVALLAWQFPYMAGNPERNAHILYLILLIALVASSGMLSRIPTSKAMRDAGIWLGLVLLIALGYSFRDDVKGTRLYGALVPNSVQITSDGALKINRAEDGHFHVEAEINNAPESFLIDTGASDIVLSQRAAIAAGLTPETLNYTRSYQTANGTVSGAPIKLETLHLGTVTLRNIEASVNKGKMDESLLGMTFLNQFKSYHVQDNQMTLYP